MTAPHPNHPTANVEERSTEPVPATATAKLNSDQRQATASGLEMLLSIEDRAREAKTEQELQYLTVNETRKLVGARQIFLVQCMRRNQFHVKAVSSLAVVDHNTPFIRWIETIVARMEKDAQADTPLEFALPAFADEAAEETACYPFRWFFWQPLKLEDGKVFAGLLMARERAWTENEQRVAARVARAYSHAWRALTGTNKLRPRQNARRLTMAVLSIATLLAGFIPVPLSTLAPVQVVAKNPYNVTAPIDGVIDRIDKGPNSTVDKGDTLFFFENTTLKNKFALADREVGIAEADYRRAMQSAFTQDEARHRLAISRAEYTLKSAERTYAHDLLKRATVTTPISGLLIYSSKDDWEGRPVTTGEKIMQIADPSRVRLKIELPVADSIVLNDGARVRVFLDSDPLHSFKAHVVRASYHAEAVSPDKLAYKLLAEFDELGENPPLIGARGTAQVFGDHVPLAFYLFRRPISYARQHLGL